MRRQRSIILILSSIVLCFYFHVKNKSIHDELNAGSTFSNPFKIVSNSSPYNKYAYLTARDLYAKHRYIHQGVDNIRWDIGDKSRVTEQLKIGVRALILKIQSEGNGARDVWIGQRSTDWDNDRHWWDSHTPALELLEEIERFLSSNPFEILTLILEDCVGASNGLAKVFEAARLTKYLFPLKKMPRNGGDWPSVKDMAAANQRLIVFTSNISKEESEGIAHTWNFMVECKYSHGNYKRAQPSCIRREYKPVTDDTSKSLVLLNYYSSPSLNEDLMNAIHACHGAASNRWANFIAIHYDKDFGTRQAIDHVNYLNGKFLCGSDDVKSCKGGMLWSSMKAVFTFLCWVWIFVLLICWISR